MERVSTQGVSLTEKEATKIDCGLLDKTQVNVVLVEKPLPSVSKEKPHYMVIPTTLKSADLCE